MSDETWRYESNARETLHAIYHILNRMRSTLDDMSLQQTRTDDELNESIQAVNYQTSVIAKELSKLDRIDFFTTEQELASISGQLRKVLDALNALRTEQSDLLRNEFLSLQKGIGGLWHYSTIAMVIGMVVIIATLRHWF
jgi:hypothetical protein